MLPNMIARNLVTNMTHGGSLLAEAVLRGKKNSNMRPGKSGPGINARGSSLRWTWN
jgi:hypothetical protein